LLRAVEVVLRGGRPVAALRPPGDVAAPEACVTIGLRWAREELAKRIAERVDRMFEEGWIGEVEDLLAAGVSAEAHALQAIGYRELVRHLHGELSLTEAREEIVRATRRYAKRQMTWFRARPEIRWIDLPNAEGIEGVLRDAEARIAAGCGPRDLAG
jgi:tRNA dimethylallyltransferase